MDLEEQIEKGNEDKIVAEKYKLIKSCYEKYLEIINDKLVENIEQNMILKFNMKEIMELNETNITHVKYIFIKVDLIQKQIENYEKIKTENPEDSNETENEIKKLTEEINNIHLTIQENETIKERIATSLEVNNSFTIRKTLNSKKS